MAIPETDALSQARRRFDWSRLARVREARDDHFWHAPRRTLLLDLLLRERVASLDAPLLDVGCGDGRLVHALCAAGIDAFGMDPWAGAQALAPQRFRTATLERIPWPDRSFGTVCALDVIEHVDDGAALRECARVLLPHGRLLVSVPAHAWLWSARDRAAGHLRRYSRRLLRARLYQCGFEVERLFGFQAVLLPLVALSRWRDRELSPEQAANGEDRPAPWLNTALRLANLLEVRLGRIARPPTGSSLIAVARRSCAAEDQPRSASG